MKGSKFPPHPLTKPEARRLIEVADDGTDLGVRNKALLVILYRAGARCAEACNLDMDDVYPIDDGTCVIRITKPKGFARGALPREVGLDRRSGRYIFDWISARGTHPGAFFITGSGARIIPSYIRGLLPRLAARGGVTRRVHPHAFRHTFARELYDEGIGLMEIMLALGHTNLSTTQKYLRSIGATEVVNTTARREW